MTVKSKILVAEDERSIRSFIGAILSSNGYDVIFAETGKEAYSMITSYCPDLVLLDLGLPDMEGMDILRAMREWTYLPVVVVSARDHERDKVSALDAGADDYITKPFSAAELLARIRTAMRHTRTAAMDAETALTGKYTVGGLVIDYDKRRVLVDGEDVHLTQNEYKLVSLLGRYPGRVLTYDAIMRELWGPGSRESNQILRVNMANIRRKIEKNPAEPRYIFTEVGVGYCMSDGERD